MAAVASVQPLPVAANDEAPDRRGVPQSRLIAGHGGRVLVLAPAGIDAFLFRLDGEPAAPVRIDTGGAEALPGLNLLANAAFGEPSLPWTVEAGDAVRLGRDIASQWTLADGHTGFASVSAGESEAAIAYRAEDGTALLPVRAGQRYALSGLFGLHRCRASLRVEMLRDATCCVASAERELARRPGGRERAGYADGLVEITAPREASFARLSLVIRPDAGEGADAHLFFTELFFGQPARDPADGWPRAVIDPHACLAVARGEARLLRVELPRPPGRAVREVAVLDGASGRPVAGSPLRLPPATLVFSDDPFDGVTLHGRLERLAGPVALELLLDGAVAARFTAAPDAEGVSDISCPIPPAWLDGAAHRIELVEAGLGAVLFAAAAITRRTLSAWDLADGAGRPSFPDEAHPLARERYRALVSHLDGRAIRRAHAVLCGRPDPDEGAHWTLPAASCPDVTVFLHGEGGAAAIRRTVAGLLFAGGTATLEVMIGALPAGADDLDAALSILPAGPDPLLHRLARAARAEYVALLAVGSEPLAGWSDDLLAACRAPGATGAAAPKLLTGEGRLLSAGGVLRASGRAEPVRFGGNAADPRAAYARRCDWAPLSGLMLPRAILDRLDGPGERDALPHPVDLAGGLARLGLPLVYVPGATVAVPGPPGPAAIDASPATRRRWADVLRDRPADAEPLARAMDRGIAGRVLFVDLQVPRPDVDAGSYAADQEMRLFAALGFKVTFLPLNLAHPGRYGTDLERRGVELIHAPFAASVEAALAARADEFDLVYITRYNVARAVLPWLRQHQTRARRLFNVADLHFLRELRAGLAAGSAEAVNRSRLTRDTEFALMREVDLTLTYSDVEAAIIQAHHLDRVPVRRLPWIVEPSPSPTRFAARSGLAFLGSFGHRPNVEAMVHFVRGVMPLLRRRLPGVTLSIHGSQMTDEVRDLASPDVLVRGHAGDLAAVYGGARVFVAPLVSGAGIKGKVLGAMAAGCPTVLSRVAAEGIGGRGGTDHHLAESPAEWVEAIARLHEYEAEWEAIARGGLDLVRRAYGFDRGVETLRGALEAVGWFSAG